MPHVLCTALNSETGPHWERLQAAGFTVSVVDRSRNLYDPQTLIEVAQGAEAVIAGSETWTRDVLLATPLVRVLSRTGVGYDAIDLPTTEERRVVVATTPGVNHHAVAEHTLALLLALVRGFPRRDRAVRDGRWERRSTPRMMGRTLGIIGLGRIGRAVATRARGLGLNVIAHDPFPAGEFAEQWGVTLGSFEDVLARSDYLTLHLPAGREVKHLICHETIQRMKPGAILINTARGSLVHEGDLIEALQSGRLGGAGLDVFEVEPLPAESPLNQLENVLLSSHVAGLDDESQHDTLSMAADTIIQLFEGRWPADRIRNLQGVRDWTW